MLFEYVNWTHVTQEGSSGGLFWTQ